MLNKMSHKEYNFLTFYFILNWLPNICLLIFALLLGPFEMGSHLASLEGESRSPSSSRKDSPFRTSYNQLEFSRLALSPNGSIELPERILKEYGNGKPSRTFGEMESEYEVLLKSADKKRKSELIRILIPELETIEIEVDMDSLVEKIDHSLIAKKTHDNYRALTSRIVSMTKKVRSVLESLASIWLESLVQPPWTLIKYIEALDSFIDQLINLKQYIQNFTTETISQLLKLRKDTLETVIALLIAYKALDNEEETKEIELLEEEVSKEVVLMNSDNLEKFLPESIMLFDFWENIQSRILDCMKKKKSLEEICPGIIVDIEELKKQVVAQKLIMKDRLEKLDILSFLNDDDDPMIMCLEKSLEEICPGIIVDIEELKKEVVAQKLIMKDRLEKLDILSIPNDDDDPMIMCLNVLNDITKLNQQENTQKLENSIIDDVESEILRVWLRVMNNLKAKKEASLKAQIDKANQRREEKDLSIKERQRKDRELKLPIRPLEERRDWNEVYVFFLMKKLEKTKPTFDNDPKFWYVYEVIPYEDYSLYVSNDHYQKLHTTLKNLEDSNVMRFKIGRKYEGLELQPEYLYYPSEQAPGTEYYVQLYRPDKLFFQKSKYYLEWTPVKDLTYKSSVKDDLKYDSSVSNIRESFFFITHLSLTVLELIRNLSGVIEPRTKKPLFYNFEKIDAENMFYRKEGEIFKFMLFPSFAFIASNAVENPLETDQIKVNFEFIETRFKNLDERFSNTYIENFIKVMRKFCKTDCVITMTKEKLMNLKDELDIARRDEYHKLPDAFREPTKDESLFLDQIKFYKDPKVTTPSFSPWPRWGYVYEVILYKDYIQFKPHWKDLRESLKNLKNEIVKKFVMPFELEHISPNDDFYIHLYQPEIPVKKGNYPKWIPVKDLTYEPRKLKDLKYDSSVSNIRESFFFITRLSLTVLELIRNLSGVIEPRTKKPLFYNFEKIDAENMFYRKEGEIFKFMLFPSFAFIASNAVENPLETDHIKINLQFINDLFIDLKRKFPNEHIREFFKHLGKSCGPNGVIISRKKFSELKHELETARNVEFAKLPEFRRDPSEEERRFLSEIKFLTAPEVTKPTFSCRRWGYVYEIIHSKDYIRYESYYKDLHRTLKNRNNVMRFNIGFEDNYPNPKYYIQLYQPAECVNKGNYLEWKPVKEKTYDPPNTEDLNPSASIHESFLFITSLVSTISELIKDLNKVVGPTTKKRLFYNFEKIDAENIFYRKEGENFIFMLFPSFAFVESNAIESDLKVDQVKDEREIKVKVNFEFVNDLFKKWNAMFPKFYDLLDMTKFSSILSIFCKKDGVSIEKKELDLLDDELKEMCRKIGSEFSKVHEPQKRKDEKPNRIGESSWYKMGDMPLPLDSFNLDDPVNVFSGEIALTSSEAKKKVTGADSKNSTNKK